jgi:hypothetical protein
VTSNTSIGLVKGTGSYFYITAYNPPSGASYMGIGGNGGSPPNQGAITVTNAGLVGIGTSNVLSLLHVRSSASRVLIDSSNQGASYDPGIEFRNYDAQIPYGAGIYAKDSTNYGTHLYFSTKVDGSNGGALTERMRITSSGYVGIGTTSPQTPLHVIAPEGGPGSGNAAYGLIVTAGSGNRAVNIGTNATVGWIQSAYTNNIGIGNILALNPNGGNVGIGTTSPNQKLHVYGNMQLDRAAAAYTIIGSTTTYAAGTWYTLVPTGALTQADATYLVTMYWQSNPGANPWSLSFSFLWYNIYCNDNSTSQLAGAAVPMSYHATNSSGDYQISIRAQSAGASYCAIQWKCNTALSNNGYWRAYCNIISY